MTLPRKSSTRRIPRAWLSLALPLVLTAGCDGGREDLQRAQQEIRNLTTQRDSLKTQLDQAHGLVERVQGRVAELESQALLARVDAPGASAASKTAQAHAGRSPGKKRHK
jgi:hypothetical protein